MYKVGDKVKSSAIKEIDGFPVITITNVSNVEWMGEKLLEYDGICWQGKVSFFEDTIMTKF